MFGCIFSLCVALTGGSPPGSSFGSLTGGPRVGTWSGTSGSDPRPWCPLRGPSRSVLDGPNKEASSKEFYAINPIFCQVFKVKCLKLRTRGHLGSGQWVPQPPGAREEKGGGAHRVLTQGGEPPLRIKNKFIIIIRFSCH